MTPITRRLFLSTALAGLASPALAGPLAVSLRPKQRPKAAVPRAVSGAKALIEQANLGGNVGFSVIDVQSGLVLEGYGPRIGQPPASVAKSVTALYALETLGSGYRFSTRLLATGPVKNGVIRGDLVLVGGGDPTLDTNALADMAAQLKAAGVRAVRGRFRVYGGGLPYTREISPDQPDYVSYNPSVSGLSLNYNRVHFEWKRDSDGYQVMMDARSNKYRPDVRVARMSVSERKTPVYTYRDGGDYDKWTVAKSALGKGGTRWLPVRKPEAYAGEVFASFARAHGIELSKAKVMRNAPKGTVLVSWQSVPLRKILRAMLKYSANLTAELVGLTATVARRGGVASLATSAQEMSGWAEIALGMENIRLVDHSGLGGSSRLSAQAMAGALAKVYKQDALKPILKKIVLRDDNGKPMKNHPIKVVAKTGTLYFVSALAGYMTAPDGTDLAFAIFAADTKRRDALDPLAMERPVGTRSWNKRAKQMQQKLIERWGAVYGS
ncbi:D-alanyl-D-alanine carboxypeptidase [hydrothermal vent metagenome]|uniref:D-alanyl-D-alanine carboxypeptidase n=1 Tax=hydrothermal vent metagenome TaxID=652676 RepID=A0A3B0S2E0_9ZZZZ